MTIRIGRSLLLAHAAWILCCAPSHAQDTLSLSEIKVTAPSPIARRTARPGRAAPASVPTPAPATAHTELPLQDTLPIVADQFATVTVVPRQEIQRSPGSTLGDLLFSKPGITGSSFAPGASSRPIIRGLDGNRVRIQENGIGANGASDLGEDHFVPVDPLVADQVEVIRGPATLRFGSQAIGGVVEATNNRIPSGLPCPVGPSTAPSPLLTKAAPLSAQPGCAQFETRAAMSSVDNGIEGATLLDAGGGNVALHADVFGRRASDYRIPSYPYLNAPDPADAPRATQPGAFNGRQPNSSLHTEGGSFGGSYLFPGGFVGLAVIQNDALYHIPGIDGENTNTRIDAHQIKILTKGEWRAPDPSIDAIRFWGGVTDYRHNELGLADPSDPSTDGVRQTFTNKEQEGRIEVQLAPVNLRFAALTTALGTQFGHQELTAPSPDNAGLWTQTPTGGLPATSSTNSSSAIRPRPRSPAGSSGWICRVPHGCFSTRAPADSRPCRPRPASRRRAPASA
jgi:iron complex outermembrane receptor protein